MYVDDRTHQLPDHGAALDVPARPSRAPGALPCGLIWLCSLPEHEVCRMPLAGVDCHSFSCSVVLLDAGVILCGTQSHPVSNMFSNATEPGRTQEAKSDVPYQRAARQTPIVLKCLNRKPDTSVCLIGVVGVDELLNHADHLWYVVCGLGLNCRSQGNSVSTMSLWNSVINLQMVAYR